MVAAKQIIAYELLSLTKLTSETTSGVAEITVTYLLHISTPHSFNNSLAMTLANNMHYFILLQHTYYIFPQFNGMRNKMLHFN